MQMPDFTSYVPPGVYVQDTSQPVVTPTTVTTNTVTIIGPSIGYQTNTELVPVYWNSNTALTKRGIFVTAVTGPPPIGAPVVKDVNGVTQVYGVDYTFVVDASGTGGAANAVTYIKRLGPVGTPSGPSPTSGLADGASVYVTYNYADTTYYTPQEFTDPSQIAATYGAAVSGTVPANPNATQVVCPLTLAAQIAMANGASNILALPTNPADGTLKEQFVAAYAKIVANYTAQLIVPLFVDGTPDSTGTPGDAHTADAVLALIQDVNTHCVTASDDGFGRIAFVGFEPNYDSATRNYDAVARQIASKRTVLAYPNQMSFYNTRLAQTTVVAGYYLAAAMAGALAGGDVARGLTSVSVTGFNSIPPALAQLQTKSFKDNLSKAGVSVVEQTRTGTLAVRHGLTTDMSSLTTREISLVRTGDVLFELVQTGMDAAGLIGEPIDVDMTTRVKGALTGILERAVTDSVIRAYTDVAVRQQSLPSGDPSVIEAQFAYSPLVPLNYITVTFAIDLSSGDITATDNTEETTTP
jgi:hypothetical protein